MNYFSVLKNESMVDQRTLVKMKIAKKSMDNGLLPARGQ